MNVNTSIFGKDDERGEIKRYDIVNSEGLSFSVIDYGAYLISGKVPDKRGKIEEITLGYDDFSSYLTDSAYLGAAVGRFANRIKNGRFRIDGQEYQVTKNHGENHLHGGGKGFSKQVWKGEVFQDDEEAGVVFSRLSPDGEEGYPGNLEVKIRYSLNGSNEFSMRYEARTDKACPINLTNHAYWNLNGPDSDSVLDHELQLFCPSYLEVDEKGIPTGTLRPVAGGVMDFSGGKLIGQDIGNCAIGYDHCYVVDSNADELVAVAKVRSPVSGRVMHISSTMPGVQFYTANHLDEVKGRGGRIYSPHAAFCLETQHFPDAMNHPDFPDPVLRPGQSYRHRTVHSFSTE